MPPSGFGNKIDKKQRLFVWILTGLIAATACLTLLLGRIYFSSPQYTPRDGDILFQSLPRSPLVDAIEGVTQSPYSHCGIVTYKEGEWVVYEALGGVEITPLKNFLSRGRDQGFAAYRLKDEFQANIPKTIDALSKYVGLPYDIHYEMDDEKIYCSELIYKAYRDATGGEQLGQLVRFGQMEWGDFEDTIRSIEKGPVPVERGMITPRDLANAKQLRLVYSNAISTNNP